jgi:hypothetical protein
VVHGGGLSTPPSFISKVEEEDGMQETHREMERRAVMRGATTMAMIGAVGVFMVRGGRMRMQYQSRMRFVLTHKINFGDSSLYVKNTKSM